MSENNRPKTVYLTVSQGLSRRLVSIVCAMRFCRDIQNQLHVYWKLPVARTGLRYHSQKIMANEHLNLFFQIPPHLKLKRWEPNTVTKAKEKGAKMLLDEQALDPEFMPKNLWNNPVYPDDYEKLKGQVLIISKEQTDDLIINFVHRPFGYGTDTVGILRTFEENAGQVWKKSPYEKTLHQFAHKLKPINTIQNIINYERDKLFPDNGINSNSNDKRPKVGFHFRRTDLRSKTSLVQLEKILKETYLPKFTHWDIFICSDDYKFQLYLTNKYPQLKAYAEPTKVQNDLAGAQRALVDLYLLSDCKHIIGTRNSAFSYYAWLLASDATTLEYHS